MIRRAFLLGCVAPVSAVLLAVALPPSAQAGVGVFRYYDTHGTDRSITNPAPGACLHTLAATRAVNGTNGPIEVYGGSDCHGLIHAVAPGEDFSGSFNSARGVS